MQFNRLLCGTCCVQLMSGANELFPACGISSVAIS
jgi:hypothetical protein